MSSTFDIVVAPGEDALEAKKKRIVPGSGMTISFSADWSKVVLGFSHKPIEERGQVWKFACGRPEAADVPDFESEHALAAQFVNCATRERVNETGLIDEYYQFIERLNYVRLTPPRRDAEGRPLGASLQQWHFIGLLKPRVMLPKNAAESDEMGDPEFWDVIDVLKLPKRGEEVQQSRKVNPYHQLALAKCVIELRDAGISKDPNFEGFKKLLLAIYCAGINIDDYIVDIQRKIDLREI